ncbi:hypothetical protein [Brevundimonas sp.]|uniref:hypothetical protein n=1 Tax=Brevundimonas sp. TaxID=1871086 RepID=UPI0027E97CAA|nr:hypothetical protein [Brevundimonas sp.]MDQ7812879.1 hypothetical protein [Brevundimonas sp.]
MLKPLETLLERDNRFALLVVPEAGGFRRMTLADHYGMVAAVNIGRSAPDEVQTMFSRAQHALIYAWFDYELSAVAEFQVLATVELALRERLQPAPTMMLKALVKLAVAQGLVPPKVGDFPAEIWFSGIRNRWAHGSANFGTPSMTLTVIEVCADLIRRLYPPQP